MTNEQINRKIAELRGWKIESDIEYPVFLRTPDGSIRLPSGMKGTPKAIEAALFQVNCPDFCGSEDAAAMLLEEMPAHTILERFTDDWVVRRSLIPATSAWSRSENRKRAICLAWLSWFESLSTEERAKVLRRAG